MLPFLAASFSIAIYTFATPVQWYATYFVAAFLTSWYWSGAAILISLVVQSELSGLICSITPRPL